MTGLRRADWRFLLPAAPGGRYRLLVLLGGGTDLARRLSGMAERIDESVDAVAEADVVILMAESDAAIPEVAARLARNAVLYVEVDRRRPGRRGLTPARLRASLRKAGLTPTACYWVVPEFARARRHVPLDTPEPLEWYLASLQTAGSRLAVMADAGVRLLAKAGAARLGAFVPCYSMVAVGAGRQPAGTGVLGASSAPVAMLTSGQDDGSRVVLLPFENGHAVPSRVVKVPRLAAFDAHTEREQRTLEELRARLPQSLRSSLPAPLGVRRWNDLLVASESYAPGVPLVVSSGRYGAPLRVAREDLRRAVDWLIAFHLATRAEGARWDDAVAERTLRRLPACRALFPAGSPVHEALDAAVQAASRLRGSLVPMVPLHNDLGPWNVHRDGAAVTVIDWELGEDADRQRLGPGPCDLFYLLTFWTFRVRHQRSRRAELRGLHELFVHPEAGGDVARAAHEEIARYAERLQLESGFLPLLLFVTWIDRAVDRVERARMAAGPEATRPDNAYARYLEVLAEGSARWFREGRWP